MSKSIIEQVIQYKHGKSFADTVDATMIKRCLRSDEENIKEDYALYLKCPWKYQTDRIGYVISNDFTFEEFKKADIQFRYNV